MKAHYIGLADANGDLCLQAIKEGMGQVLEEMYSQWPFFQATVDLVEMVLSYVALVAALCTR